MRLKTEEQQLIVELCRQYYPDCQVYLFGSRVDDAKRGGDIDLFLLTKNPVPLAEKLRLLVELERRGLQRKIDLIIQTKHQAVIYPEVLQQGVALC